MASPSSSDKTTSDPQKSDKDRDENEGKKLGQNKIPMPNSKTKNKRARGEQTEAKKTSWVWKHFTVVKKPLMSRNEEGIMVQVGLTNRAQCRYCQSDLACNSTRNGTSTLQKHLELHCHSYPGSARNTDSSQKHFSRDGEGNESIVTHWTQENCTKAAVEMIIIDEMPFSAIEKSGFKRFCSVVVPKWKIPCRKMVVKHFLSMYNSKKECLKEELRNHCVCLTTDTWTSIQNINYMVITAHFIDSNWNMHKRVLNFCVIPNHQGITIGKILEKCLQDWSIKKILTISVDNASANKVAIDYMRRKLGNGEKQQILGGKFLHMRCLAHVVNLIVKSGLKCMDKSIASIRNAVKYVRSSPARLETFKECVIKEELQSRKVCVLDVPTRWNSTFIMLETAVKLRQAFERLAEEEETKYKSYFDEDDEENEDVEDDVLGIDFEKAPDEPIGGQEAEIIRKKKDKGVRGKKVGPPTEDDWEKVVAFVKFLRVFFDVTLNVSASSKPTAHKAFHDIVSIKYPRFKLRYFSRVLERMLNYDAFTVKVRTESLKELIVTLTDLYASMNGVPNSSTKKAYGDETGSGSSCSSNKLTGKKAKMMEDWKKDLEDVGAVVVAHEVDRYLLDPIEKPGPGVDFDILSWWRLMEGKYPNLQALAKDVLAIQVSTVASESSFSTGKRVIDPHRSSLTPRSVEALICLQSWLKSDAITTLAYTPTPDEIEWLEKTEQELDQEEREHREKLDKQKEIELIEKKNKVMKASKGSDAANSSKKKI
ncbi:BED zinc finger [Striga asiatica]|uniref:BED zinc finger n=1 Tax=Striga asiatica TaxID=4170 RepID=A0A5A7PR27_STRAF|nr:BED zinc finger [Striga asiatica]